MTFLILFGMGMDMGWDGRGEVWTMAKPMMEIVRHSPKKMV